MDVTPGSATKKQMEYLHDLFASREVTPREIGLSMDRPSKQEAHDAIESLLSLPSQEITDDTFVDFLMDGGVPSKP